MPNTYYDSSLTGEQIEAALTAIDGVVSQENNGKVLAIENGKIVAKSASEWTDTPVLEPLNVTANGDYTPPSGTDGFNSVHVAVPGAGTIEPLSVTENGTYNPPSGVDGYAPVTVSVSGGGGGGLDNFVGSFYIGGVVDVPNKMAGKLAGYFYVKDASYNDLIIDWSQPFEIKCTYKHLTTNRVALFGSMGTYYHAPSIESRPSNDAVWVGISLNGGSWGMTKSIPVSIPTNTWITVTETWDGSTLTVTVDNGTTTVTDTMMPSTIYAGDGSSFQFGNVSSDSNLKGTNWFLNLEQSYIKSNGVTVWGNAS